MELISIAVGVLLLLVGRRMFWLFVGLAGFLCGFQSGQIFFPEQAMLGIVFGLLLGVVGIFVAVFFQRLSFAIGGFFAGGYLGLAVCSHFQWEALAHVCFVAAGLLCAILAYKWMDWGIIVLSAFAGASAIVFNAMVPLSPHVAICRIFALGRSSAAWCRDTHFERTRQAESTSS